MVLIPSSRIVVTGIRAEGRHGANPGEKDESQTFVVDLDVLLDVGGDTLDQTIDYGSFVEAVRQEVTGQSYDLLETLAERVAQTVFQYGGVTRARVVVHKPGAAASLGVDDVSAEATVG